MLFLVWLLRDRLQSDERGRSGAAALLLAAAVGLALAQAASIDLLVWGAVPVLARSAIGVALGAGVGLVLAAPVFYFLVAVPVWGVLTPPLQLLTVKAVTLLLALVGQQAHIEGEFVTVPAGTVEIAGGCAVTNFMVVVLAIATFLAVLERLPAQRAAWLLVAGAVVAAVANWLRVAIIIYLGQRTQMQSPLIEDHYTLGWWLCAAGLVPFLVYSRRLAAQAPLAAQQAGVATPLARVPGVRLGGGVGFAALALVAAATWSWAVEHRDPGPDAGARVPASGRLAGPGGRRVRLAAAVPGSGRGATHDAPSQRPVGRGVGCVLRTPGAARETVGEQSRVAGDPERWSETEVSRVEVGAASGLRSAVTQRRIGDAAGGERLVWFWYEVRGERLIDARDVKLREGLGAFGARPRSGIVAIRLAPRRDRDAAAVTLAAAWNAGLAALSAGTGEQSTWLRAGS